MSNPFLPPSRLGVIVGKAVDGADQPGPDSPLPAKPLRKNILFLGVESGLKRFREFKSVPEVQTPRGGSSGAEMEKTVVQRIRGFFGRPLRIGVFGVKLAKRDLVPLARLRERVRES